MLKSAIASVTASKKWNAECEGSSNVTTYSPFIAPKIRSDAPGRSYYNFLHDSLPYHTTNKEQLSLYDNYMNDVLKFSSTQRLSSITKCLKNDKNDDYKQLLCKSLCADYYVSIEDSKNAQKQIKSAYNSFNTDNKDLFKYDREQLYTIGFYQLYVENDYLKSLETFEHLSNEYPFDLYAAKRAQTIAFDLSDWDRMLSIYRNIEEYHLADGVKNPKKLNNKKIPSAYFNGLLSFGWEQVGMLSNAEKYAKEGLEYYYDDCWLQHTLMHSRYFQKNSTRDVQELIDFLVKHGSQYWDIDNISGFMTTHNWWHIGLLYLELDKIDKTMELLKKNIWRKNLNTRADQIGALSMFWILEMIIDSKQTEEGSNSANNEKYVLMKKDIYQLWSKVMDYVYETNNKVGPGYRLYDLLFMRGVIQMMKISEENNDIETYNKYKKRFDKYKSEMVNSCKNDKEGKAKYIGVLDAMYLMYGGGADNKKSKGKLDKAYKILSKEIYDMNAIGGSREQRFVFDQMYVDLLLKNNKMKQLKEYLDYFLSRYPLKSLEIIAANMA